MGRESEGRRLGGGRPGACLTGLPRVGRTRQQGVRGGGNPHSDRDVERIPGPGACDEAGESAVHAAHHGQTAIGAARQRTPGLCPTGGAEAAGVGNRSGDDAATAGQVQGCSEVRERVSSAPRCHPERGEGSYFTRREQISRQYFAYIMSSHRRTLYVGVTNSLSRRVRENRSGKIADFTKRYNVDRLVYAESFGYIEDALNIK